MLYQYALVVSRYCNNLFYGAVKYNLYLGSRFCGYVYSVIERKFYILECRVRMFTEFLYYNTL